ncbi:uncharacterized protein VP01_1605g1 [Puccinia sorghi]|uniref:Uncharacterized protein n=1 Tax=Puccinia sorghi TaxID=27349 RepID=A0A0L6VHA6_9BASI|nr:uncharacterized protein VP01_1605g1 [Puccinia sorghi]
MPRCCPNQGCLHQAIEDNCTKHLADEDQKNTASIIAASQLIYDLNFINKANTNVHHKRIGPILLHSVEFLLEDYISTLPTFFVGYTNLKNEFNAIFQSAQVMKFLKLLKTDPDNHPIQHHILLRCRILFLTLKT